MSQPPENRFGDLHTGLGSLAGAARAKQIKQARRILIGIGILTIVVNAIMLFIIPGQVRAAIDKEVQQLQGRGMRVDPAALQAAEHRGVLLASLVTWVVIFLGALFVVFGLIVNRYPVPITITSLVLYVGAAAVFGVLDPMTLLQGIIMKVIIVVALIKAVQAAIAAQREQTAALAEPTL